MNLRTLPLDQLKPAPYNPRVSLVPGSPAYRRLERSLDEFSLVQPLVWNEETGHIVGGHQRLTILKNRGVTEVEVVVVSLSLAREKALNVALNNSQVAGDWDAAKLVDLMAELQALPDFDATLTGFDANDLQELLMTPDPLLTSEGDDDGKPDVVEMTIEIPPEKWEDVRPDLDRLVANFELTVHVKLPNGAN